jgi:Phage integrase, N-terminal SAM-like domain
VKGRTFKRCGCTDQQTGRELGNACPKLRRRNGTWSADHGVWHIQIELPRRDNGTRRTLRRSGFTTLRDAETEIEKISALIAVTDPRDTTARARIGDLIEQVTRAKQPLPNPENVRTQLDAGLDLDHMPTVGQWLERWLAGRKTLRKGTVCAYSIHIRRWLTPQLGHLPLDKLTVDHVAAMFDAIAERNDAIEAAQASDDPQIRASVKGLRTTGPATMQRYRATLRAALNAAIRAKKITFNPASYVELPSGKRPKALLWTDERIRRWHQTGQKPSRVMIWTPEQTGQFLDHAAEDPLYPLFHLIAFRGLRRGEACGLPWSETDLTNQTITITAQITQVGWAAEFGEPKSDASGRVVSLDTDTAKVLRAHRARQNRARRALGEAWVDSGLVFTDTDGSPLHPAKITTRFQEHRSRISTHPAPRPPARRRHPHPRHRRRPQNRPRPPRTLLDHHHRLHLRPCPPRTRPRHRRSRRPHRPPRTARNTGARIEPGVTHKDRRRAVRRRKPAGRRHRGGDPGFTWRNGAGD